MADFILKVFLSAVIAVQIHVPTGNILQVGITELLHLNNS